MPRDDYEERRAARIERLKRRAEAAKAESARLWDESSAMAKSIPFGQPILVGHHSERRDRNFRDRIARKADRSCEKATEARDLAARAEAAECNRTISSDDPEAVAKLCRRLAQLRASRDAMKRANAAWRAAQKDPTVLDDDGKYGDMLPSIRANLRTWTPPYSFVKVPYDLSNLGANIRRIEQRIKDLEVATAEPPREPIVGQGWRIEERPDLNRITITFDDRPDRETCKRLRLRGWRWSPTEGAWLRHLNSEGRSAALWFAEAEGAQQ